MWYVFIIPGANGFMEIQLSKPGPVSVAVYFRISSNLGFILRNRIVSEFGRVSGNSQPILLFLNPVWFHQMGQPFGLNGQLQSSTKRDLFYFLVGT
jgi:hypothetical protein